MKWKKWLSIVCGILVVQFGTFFYLNQFLKPPVLSAVAPVATAQAASSTPKVNVPDNAIDPLMNSDQQYVAYTTENHELVVDGIDGTAIRKPIANVVFKKWLDNSTLLYFNQTSGLAAYIIQITGDKSVLVDTWSGTKWQVMDSYFSPYVELLYMELKDRNGYDHIFCYDATTGVSELPLGLIHIESIDYDAITDTMKIYDHTNRMWLFENNQLTRPDGSKVVLTISSSGNARKGIRKNETITGSGSKNGKGKNTFEIKSVNGK